MNEKKWRRHVVDIAEKHIGVKEGSPAHDAIRTAYNNHKPLPRGYALKPADPWCAAFVSVVAILADCDDIIPQEVSCGEMLNHFKSRGRFTEDDNYVPTFGDVVFYNWDNAPTAGDNIGAPDHVGIVAEVCDGFIYVPEGNFDNEVGIRKIPVGWRYIRGYGLPDYGSKATPDDLDTIADEVLNGKWGNNPERRARLIAAGYDYDAVQSRVNEMVKVNTVALEVIAGKWGNGSDRRERLQKAGFSYDEVQRRVNEILNY